MKKLDPSDFRAVRQILTGDDFAVSEGPDYDQLKRAMVARQVWFSIQELPDTVAVATSGQHGPELELEDELHGEWIRQIGFDADNNLLSDVVMEVAFDAETEWQAATFAALHGYYRQAIGTLRNALEGCVIAARYQHDRKNPFYEKWLAGLTRTNFSELCRQVAEGVANNVNRELRARGHRALIDRPRRSDSWLYGLYEELCNPAHSRPSFTHASYWSGSNGPIYERTSFLRFHHLFLEAMTGSWILCKLARPSILIPAPIIAETKSGGLGREAQIIWDVAH
jgi:hypothetical protein